MEVSPRPPVVLQKSCDYKSQRYFAVRMFQQVKLSQM